METIDSINLRDFDEDTNYLVLLRNTMNSFMEKSKRKESIEIKTAIYNLRRFFYFKKQKTFYMLFENIFEDFLKVLTSEDENSCYYCLHLVKDIFLTYDDELELFISEILDALLNISSFTQNPQILNFIYDCLNLNAKNMFFTSNFETLILALSSKKEKKAQNAFVTLSNFINENTNNTLFYQYDWAQIFQAIIDMFSNCVNKDLTDRFEGYLYPFRNNLIEKLGGDRYYELLADLSQEMLIDLKDVLLFNHADIINLKNKRNNI